MAVQILALILVSLISEVYPDIPYKLCSLAKDESDCAQLKTTQNIQCVNIHHGIDCILNIEQGTTDFGRITPEQALVATNFINDVVVLGEFHSDAIYDDSLYATAVLVRSEDAGGFAGLKGKRYCHPGFKFDATVTDLILKEFENAVLKANNAEGCLNVVKSGTIFEKELKALSDFFGPSCRPGPWIDIQDQNVEYYKRYKSLCDLCNTTEQCALPSGVAPFTYSFHCMVDKGGDIALTTIHTINEYFNKPENSHKKNNYKLLCRNNTYASLDDPCVWSKQSLNLIITNKKQEEAIKRDLQIWLGNSVIGADQNASLQNPVFENALTAVFFPYEKEYNRIRFLNQSLNLNDYIKQYRTIPNVNEFKKCDSQIKWCTVSQAEQEKCLWLAQASLNNAIQPTIACFQSTDKLACLDELKLDKVDVTNSDAYYTYIAKRKNLIPLAFPQTDSKDVISAVVVIRDSNERGIQNFKDLKDKSACFPEYGGIEFTSFVNHAHALKLLSNTTCDYEQLLHEFVGDSCVPGAHNTEREVSPTTNQNLCNLCVPDPIYSKTAKTCNSDPTNMYNGNSGALKCLKEVGDFAVITQGDYLNFNLSQFRVLCRNGSLALYRGLNVDSDCVLSTTISNEIVAKTNSSKNEDIILVLSNLERLFGTARRENAFELFSVFNNTHDLMFKDFTMGFDKVTSNNKYAVNHMELFRQADVCLKDSTGDSATSLKVAVFPLILTYILLVWY